MRPHLPFSSRTFPLSQRSLHTHSRASLRLPSASPVANLSSVPWLYWFGVFRINGIMQHGIFHVWLLSSTATCLRVMRIALGIVATGHHMPCSIACWGRLGCFYFLAAMHSAALMMPVHVFSESLFPAPWGIYLGAEFLDHVVMAHVTFLRNHQIVFRPWLYHVTFPPATHKGSGFSTCLSTLVIFQFLKILAILVGVQRPLTVLCSDSHLPKDSRC